MNQSPVSLIHGFFSFLNPFQKGFSRKEETIYCSRRQGPTGLWEKLPELHYCLFNRGKEHLLKTDVELQAGKVSPSKKAIILITDDATGRFAGLDLKEWVTALRDDWNVAVIHLHESPRNVPMWKDVVTVGPLVRGDLPQVVRREVQDMTACIEVDAVIALSLESGDVLKPLREGGLPILHIIPEFLHTPRQLARLKKSRRDATIQLFPGESWRKRAAEGIAITPDQRMVVLADVSSAELTANISDLIKTAGSLIKQEEQQIEVLLSSGVFLMEYAIPDIADDRVAAGAYLAAWQSGWKPRKPCPGFHPGIYRDHHPELTTDPTIDFIRQGKPVGVWLSEVMREEERESLKVKSDCNREYIAVGMAWIDPATAGPQRGELSGRERVKGNREPIRAALHLHLHYTEGVGELLHKIKVSTSQPDLFISTTSEEGKVRVKGVLDKYGLQAQEIAVFPNRGRDIGPFLSGFAPRLFKKYEIVGHLHSKKSPHAHDDYLQNWVEFLEKGLVGEKGGMMDGILEKMASDPSIGIIYPDDPGCFGWEGNYSYGKALIDRLGYKAPRPDASMNFPVGTMFWARTAALKPLLDLNLQWEDYPEEPIPIDGSMLHALERIFGILPGLCGFRNVVTTVEGIAR
jgi:hypothetical protein